jgi:hypothetical protein
MATKSFLPVTDKGLLLWAQNFSSLISAGAVSYGLTSSQATAFAALLATYTTDLAAVDPGVRSKATVLTKNAARGALVTNARALAKIVEATPTVTNTQKATLGLTVRVVPAPIPAPSTAPVVQVVSVTARTVQIRLRSATGSSRGKPPGVKSATVFSYVGAMAPTDITLWQYQGVMTKVVANVVFPNTTAGGSLVWITAIWANARGQSGPAADPVSTNIAGGGVGAMAA